MNISFPCWKPFHMHTAFIVQMHAHRMPISTVKFIISWRFSIYSTPFFQHSNMHSLTMVHSTRKWNKPKKKKKIVLKRKTVNRSHRKIKVKFIDTAKRCLYDVYIFWKIYFRTIWQGDTHHHNALTLLYWDMCVVYVCMMG